MSLIQQIKQFRIKTIASYYRFFPIQENKILLWSDLGHRYSCNPRYLTEYILKSYPEKFDVVWMFDQEAEIPKNLPKSIRIVRYFSISWLREIATAKYIICNTRIPEWFFFHKRKGQRYIQTWHGSVSLKYIEKDAEHYLGNGYVQSAIKDSAQTDYLISGCDFHTKLFQNSFWYHGKILSYGTPRVDFLLSHKGEQNTCLSMAGLNPDTHYVLYAPTFRNQNALTAYNLDSEQLVQTLSEKLGGKWKVLYRLHPNIAKKYSLSLSEHCIDMNSYPDIQILLIAADILITDFSSSMFDMAFLNKPCFLFASDYENYISKERPLYFNIKTLPFPFAETNEALKQNILNFSPGEYETGIKTFLSNIGSLENGTGCQQICQELFKNLY